MRTRAHPRQGAFTLLEVLIALAIVAIALSAALRAAAIGADNARELRLRLLAELVAQNVLAEHRMRADWTPVGAFSGTARQGDLDFVWREDIAATATPAFRRVDVYVYGGAGDAANAHATGF